MLQKYSDDGGKILWISSAKATFLGDFSYKLNLHRIAADFQDDILRGSQVLFAPLLRIKGESSDNGTLKAFTNLPINDSWLQTASSLTISNSDKMIIPLISTKLNSSELTLAAYYARSEHQKDKARHVAISSAVLFPFMFSEKISSINKPELDPAAANILINSLNLLK